MSDKKIYGAYGILPGRYRRGLLSVSHSVKALKRRHPDAAVYAVIGGEVPFSSFGTMEYERIGDEL